MSNNCRADDGSGNICVDQGGSQVMTTEGKGPLGDGWGMAWTRHGELKIWLERRDREKDCDIQLFCGSQHFLKVSVKLWFNTDKVCSDLYHELQHIESMNT